MPNTEMLDYSDPMHDSACDAEFEANRYIASELSVISFNELSQAFEDCGRIHGIDKSFDYRADLVQLRIALSSHFASQGRETKSDREVRAELVYSSMINLMRVIGE